MKDNYIFQNNSFNENEDEEVNNSFFNINQNSLFPKEDSSSNYFNNVYDIREEEEINYNNENNNIINDFQDKSYSFLNNENNINKEFSLISPIPLNDDDSYKLMNDSNLNNNEIIKGQILIKDGNSSGVGTDDTPLSTRGSGSKNQSKEPSLNNSNISNPKINNNNFVSFTNEKIKENKKNSKNSNNTVLSKKRKQRIHLEDLNIDPELIKCKKYQTIGDKVITSRNSVITDLDKKEIRAIRNRISAQKSRDRKKAEFLNLQLQLKYLQQQIEKQNMVIHNFEKELCDTCKSKFRGIILENNNFNINMDDQNQNEKEFLVLDENSSDSSDKKNSLLGKLTGVFIALVCLLGITLCVVEGGFIISNKNKIENVNNLNIRNLNSENDEEYIDENQNISNINITDEDLDINVPLLIKPNRIKNFGNNLNKLQIYHDKFGFDIYSFLKNKKFKKNGFLMKTSYNDSIIDNPICFETKNIEHNNYIIDNSLDNTLPVEAKNIALDNNLSKKIISVFIKDYEILQRYLDGKSLSLEEQIEIEANNSQDGCVYIQMIIPRYKITNYGDNETYYEDGFFEIRGKIFAYNNYYDGKVAASF